MAALFRPLSRRIQDGIDHCFYRRKYDADKTLGGFAARLRHETDLDSLSDEFLKVAQETMRPEHVSLWLRPPVEEKKDEPEKNLRPSPKSSSFRNDWETVVG